jgi:hypothetical protein
MPDHRRRGGEAFDSRSGTIFPSQEQSGFSWYFFIVIPPNTRCGAFHICNAISWLFPYDGFWASECLRYLVKDYPKSSADAPGKKPC